jgi:hypothetical protein
MNRGLLLSSDVKSRCWPWAPSYTPVELQAPVLTDPVWQFVPWLELARRELEAGRLPLWNPHQNGGVPLLANPMLALGSPLIWPVLLLGVGMGWNLSLLLRLVVAAVGMYFWLREVDRSRPASALGALAFSISGPFVAWLENPNSMVVAFVPLLLLFARRLTRATTGAGFAAVAFATYTVVAGGHPETAAISLVVVAGAVALEVRGWRPLARAAVAAGLGVLLAAPLLVPFAEYLSLSAAAQGEDRAVFTLSVSALGRFIVPHTTTGNPITEASTVSVVGLCLALFGLGHIRRSRQVRYWAGVAFLIVVVSYDNPVSRLLALHTPLYWTRSLILLPLALGFLAATGLDSLRSLAKRRLGERSATLAASALVVMACVELLAAARGVHAVTPPEDVDLTTPLLRRLTTESEPFRILPLHTFLPPDSATALGLDDVRGYDAITPRAWLRERETMGRFTSTNIVTDVLEPRNLAPGGRALDLWNVKYLLLHPQLPYTAKRLNSEFGLDLEESYLGSDGRLLRNRRVLPRARLRGEGTVHVTERRTTRWRLDVDARESTVLVLANPMFPGWRARVDGKRAPIATRTGTPIEVRVSAGRHTVEISYEPLSFRLGAGMCAAALFVLGMIVWHIGWAGRLAARPPRGETTPG